MSERDDELGSLIREKATRHAAPPHLRARVSGMLSQEGIGLAARPPKPAVRQPEPWRRWFNMAGAFAVGMLLSVTVLLVVRGGAEDGRMAQTIVDAHVRSLLGEHLVDVKSSDRHTVKPWFTGKLDYAPPVIDLAPEIPLVGGRLDYLGQRPVSALIYKLNLHTVNVFVWPANGETSKDVTFYARQGFNVAYWVANGMQFWAVSDANVGELRKVTDRLIAATDHH
ncbi:MAG TPA: anti-sigma factor [Burkholderiales bacterium]|nr:anti-sigma factor [Burkholderiales bacterium]